MDLSTLRLYREKLARCFTRAQGALGDLCDALLTDLSARSLIDLAQAACFQRRWSSVDAALADGQVDRPALQRLFVESAPRPTAGQRLVLAIDASSIARPEARTAPDRTLVHVPNLPSGCAPVRPGWAFSTVVVVPTPVSSWTHILDNQRIPSTETAVSVAAQQLRDLLPVLPERPIGLLDGGYGTVSWVTATAHLPVDQLVRITRLRVLYRPAPPPSGKRGAPRKDGARFKCSDPTTHGEPDAHWAGTDAQSKQITVSCWGGFHLKECREITLTVVRIVRAGAEGTKSDPRETWFWWLGGAPVPPLEEVGRLYPLRFGAEHGYRFDKQDLLWTAPHVRTPAQMQRWTDVVAAVHNQISVARPLVAAQRQPWETARRPVTPRQGRRSLGRIISQVGPLAPAPRSRGKAPGRAPGAVIKHAPRCPVIRKSPPKAAKRPKKRLRTRPTAA